MARYDYFHSGHPTDNPNYLFGRAATLKSINSHIGRRGKHLMIIGPRGVGKTSAVFCYDKTLADDLGYVKVEPKMTFERLMTELLAEFNLSCSDTSINSYRRALGEDGKRKIMIVDDFETAIKSKDRETLAEGLGHLSKHLSDSPRSRDTTLIIIGSAYSAASLFPYHQSVSRTIELVEIGPINEADSLALIDSYQKETGNEYDPTVRRYFAKAAMGFPYFIHKMGEVMEDLIEGKLGAPIGWSVYKDALKRSVKDEAKKHQRIYRAQIRKLVGLERDIIRHIAIYAQHPISISALYNKLQSTAHRWNIKSEQDFKDRIVRFARDQRYLYVTSNDLLGWENPLLAPFIRDSIMFTDRNWDVPEIQTEFDI